MLALLVGARWMQFGSAMILFGSSLLPLYAGLPQEAMPTPIDCGLRRMLRYAALIALVSGVLWLVGSIAMVAGDWTEVGDMGVLSAYFFETPFGPVWIMRLVLLLILAAASFSISRRRSLPILACLSGALLVSQAWLGHAADGEGFYGGLEIGSYAVHVLAAAAWLGALPALAAIVSAAAPATTPDRLIDRVLARFSAMGMTAVALILLTGIANSCFRLASIASLFTTLYGGLILCKLALLGILGALATQNRLQLMPRIAARSVRAAAAAKTLLRNIGLEEAGGLAILLAAALLGLLSPAG